MAIPVINTTTSVLGYLQWESWAYQPYATNTPTSWTSSALPPGLSLNGTTGRISGASTSAGVYLVALTAINGDGSSTPLVITIGIGPAEAALTSSAIDVSIDVVTRDVTVATDLGLFAKQGDDIMLAVKFRKKDTVLELDLEELSLFLRKTDAEPQIVISDGWVQRGSGTGTYYLLHASVARADVLAALSDEEAEPTTTIEVIAEFEWVETNADTADLGPDSVRFSTRNFPYKIGRDLGEVA